MDKTIKLMPVETTYQLAGIFTKPLPRQKLLPTVCKVNLKNIFKSPS